MGRGDLVEIDADLPYPPLPAAPERSEFPAMELSNSTALLDVRTKLLLTCGVDSLLTLTPW